MWIAPPTCSARSYADEADEIVPAMEEALEIGRALNCMVVFSHHKLAGGRNHGRSAETLAIVERAARLQPVCLDCHPYPATSTMLRLDRVRIARRTMITWSTGYPQAQGRDFADVQRELGLDDEQTLHRRWVAYTPPCVRSGWPTWMISSVGACAAGG